MSKMIKENNEKAKALLADENDGSLGKAQDVYKFLASFDEDQERLKEYESNITSIDEIIKHKDTLKRLKAEHATLGGFFKKKKRLEVEEKIRQVESKIDEIKCTLK